MKFNREQVIEYIDNGYSLAGGDFSGLDLSGISFYGRNLEGADFTNTVLYGTSFQDTILTDAKFTNTDLHGVNFKLSTLTRAVFENAIGLPEVPVVPSLNREILYQIENKGTLNMSDWHICDTTHCISGWAIHIAGLAGSKLESDLSQDFLGALLFLAAGSEIPDFYTDEADAYSSLKERANRETRIIVDDLVQQWTTEKA